MKKMTPEEKLLKAIFGPSKVKISVCFKCRRNVDYPIYYNGKPYHSRCLPPSGRTGSW